LVEKVRYEGKIAKLNLGLWIKKITHASLTHADFFCYGIMLTE